MLNKIKGSEPISIGKLERFVADYAMQNNTIKIPEIIKSKNHKKIAIIGAGPAGLSAAGSLAINGFEVTIFEAFSKPGGVLYYGIPEFRLPKKIIDWEIKYLKNLGVKFECDCLVGKTVTIQELKDLGFVAFFVGTGAGLPNFMGIPGEDLSGVFSANEFLTRSNMMSAYKFPLFDTPLNIGKRTVVIGGGNVAMDAARTALRIGYEEVRIIYRRSREEMPARYEEICHAEEEGIIFELLTLPLKYIDDGKGKVSAVECIRMQLGEPDAKGRRTPISIKDSNFIIPCDSAIVSIGNSVNPILINSGLGVNINSKGHVIVDPLTYKTSVDGFYAGGDIVTGAATVIEAMGAGQKAACAIGQI